MIDSKIKRERQEQRPEEKPFTAEQMAERMRLDPSLFSRWRSGGAAGVNRETLTSMLLGYSNDDLERAKLLQAFLIDQKTGRPGEKHVQVIVVGETPAINDPVGEYGADEFAVLSKRARDLSIDSKTVAALEKIICGLDQNPDLRRVLISLSKMAT